MSRIPTPDDVRRQVELAAEQQLETGLPIATVRHNDQVPENILEEVWHDVYALFLSENALSSYGLAIVASEAAGVGGERILNSGRSRFAGKLIFLQTYGRSFVFGWTAWKLFLI